MNTQLALLRRELWEHRSIYVVPLVIALVVSLMSVTGQVVVSAFDHAIDLAILGASNLGERERALSITALMTAISTPFVLTMWVLSVFYLLDSLYAERKDKSILFWRSLPVTDTETVLSKLATALIVIPLVTFVVIMATDLLVLAISGIWVSMRGGSASHLIWSAAPLLENWLATLVFVLALPLWLSPFAGWFLLVSAWTRRSPMLMAVLPLVVAPMLERILIGTSFVRDAIFVRSGQMPLFRGFDTSDYLFREDDQLMLAEGSPVTLLPLMDIGKFVTSPGLWLGLAVCALLSAGAVYVRRYRDDA